MSRRCIVSAVIGSAVLWGLLIAAACLLAGCAVGRGPAGQVVLGMEAGTLVETAGEAANAAAAFLPPPFNYLATAVLGVVGGGGIAGARALRKGERAGWEEAAATYSPPPPVAVAASGPVAGPAPVASPA